jgi:hypothetical protein
VIRLRPAASDGSGAGAWGAGSVMAGLIPSRYPPDKQEKATLTVLEQAELLWGDVAAQLPPLAPPDGPSRWDMGS